MSSPTRVNLMQPHWAGSHRVTFHPGVFTDTQHCPVLTLFFVGFFFFFSVTVQ